MSHEPRDRTDDHRQAEHPAPDQTDEAERHDQSAAIGRQILSNAMYRLKIIFLVIVFKTATAAAIVVVVGVVLFFVASLARRGRRLRGSTDRGRGGNELLAALWTFHGFAQVCIWHLKR